MRRTYLFVFGFSLGTHEQVLKCVQSLPSVVAWRYDMQNAFYIVSDFDANTIAIQIKNHFNNNGLFIVTQISAPVSDTQGWLPRASWHLIQTNTLMPGG